MTEHNRRYNDPPARKIIDWTDYYVVAVDDMGDVTAIRAKVTHRSGLSMTVESVYIDPESDVNGDPRVAFENQGNDDEHIYEAVRDAMASVLEARNHLLYPDGAPSEDPEHLPAPGEPATWAPDPAGDMETDYPEDRPHDQLDDPHNQDLGY